MRLMGHCKECKKEDMRRRYHGDRDIYLAKRAEWALQTYVHRKESQAVATANSRARKRGLAATLTLDEWYEVIGEHVNGSLCCAYCNQPAGENYELDHVVSMQRPDCPGSVKSNVVPSCRPCNRAKEDRSAEEHMAWIGRVGEGAK